MGETGFNLLNTTPWLPKSLIDYDGYKMMHSVIFWREGGGLRRVFLRYNNDQHNYTWQQARYMRVPTHGCRVLDRG